MPAYLYVCIADAGLFSSEVGRNVSPFARVPLDEFRAEGVRAQPVFGSCYDVIQLCGLGRALQFCLTLHLPYPCYGREAVAVYGLLDAFLLHKRQCMHDGKEFANVVCSEHRTVMKHHSARSKVDASVLHLSRIAAARRVNSPCVSLNFQRKRQYCVITIIWRITVS